MWLAYFSGFSEGLKATAAEVPQSQILPAKGRSHRRCEVLRSVVIRSNQVPHPTNPSYLQLCPVTALILWKMILVPANSCIQSQLLVHGRLQRTCGNPR